MNNLQALDALKSSQGSQRVRSLIVLPSPNESRQSWTTHLAYKGEFLLGNRQYCYPLTVTDHASRYLLCLRSALFYLRRLRFHRI
jgi:hypothetical protein